MSTKKPDCMREKKTASEKKTAEEFQNKRTNSIEINLLIEKEQQFTLFEAETK